MVGIVMMFCIPFSSESLFAYITNPLGMFNNLKKVLHLFDIVIKSYTK